MIYKCGCEASGDNVASGPFSQDNDLNDSPLFWMELPKAPEGVK